MVLLATSSPVHRILKEMNSPRNSIFGRTGVILLKGVSVVPLRRIAHEKYMLVLSVCFLLFKATSVNDVAIY